MRNYICASLLYTSMEEDRNFGFFTLRSKLSWWNSVATKIENGPKTNTKILRFLKIDRRRIQRIFINSKILWRSSKIANSLNIFKVWRFSKENKKNFVVKNFLSGSNLEQIFPAVELNIMWGKLKFKVLRKVHISGLFQTILSKILLNFPKKSSQSSA